MPERDVWVTSESGDWVLGRASCKLEQDDDSISVRLASGETKSFEKKDLLFANENLLAEDLTSLQHVHTPGILATIEERSHKNLPYTFLGPILIVANPVHRVADNGEFRNHDGSYKPHPYAVAQQAYQQMVFSSRVSTAHLREDESSSTTKEWGGVPQYKVDQSIVIGGESGSGKTEAAKLVLKHLARKVSQQALADMEQSLLKVNAVFEAFGNASTQSNHNSSRFGKLTSLYFNDTELCSAGFKTYLLERSRVSCFGPGERNYHVFYHMLAGAPDVERDGLGLPPPAQTSYEEFKILAPMTSKCGRGGGAKPFAFADDLHGYERMKQGMGAVGMCPSAQLKVLRLLAALLHLGNIEFHQRESQTDQISLRSFRASKTGLYTNESKTNNNDGEDEEDEDISALTRAAILLEIPEASLRSMLLEKKLTIASETLTVHRNADEARKVRDSLLREVYSSLFSWMVQQINLYFRGPSSDPDKSPTHRASIGVLDIFGFEIFPKNGLDQLLINYANEALQKVFEMQILEAEANLYKSEGILVNQLCQSSSQTSAASGCLHIIDGKHGILSLIDDFSFIPQPSDDKLFQNIAKRFEGHSALRTSRKLNEDRMPSFMLDHYAGTVTYCIDQFVKKNADRVHQEVVETLRKSGDQVLVSKLFESEHEKRATRSSSRKRGLCSKFSSEISALKSALCATNCLFIRCVKPNPNLVRGTGRGWFNRQYVQRQLCNLSIPQTASLLSQGAFPVRLSYEEFFGVCKDLLSDAFHARHASLAAECIDKRKALVRAVFHALEMDHTLYKFGFTRIFFRSSAVERFQMKIAGCASSKLDNRVSSYLHRWIWRRAVTKSRSCAIFIRLLLQQRYKLASRDKIVSFFRKVSARNRFVRSRTAAVTVQSFLRACAAQKMVRTFKAAMLAKKLEAEQRHQRMEATVVTIQGFYRICSARRVASALKAKQKSVKRVHFLEGSKDSSDDLQHCLKTKTFAEEQDHQDGLEESKDEASYHSRTSSSQKTKQAKNSVGKEDCIQLQHRREIAAIVEGQDGQEIHQPNSTTLFEEKVNEEENQAKKQENHDQTKSVSQTQEEKASSPSGLGVEAVQLLCDEIRALRNEVAELRHDNQMLWNSTVRVQQQYAQERELEMLRFLFSSKISPQNREAISSTVQERVAIQGLDVPNHQVVMIAPRQDKKKKPKREEGCFSRWR